MVWRMIELVSLILLQIEKFQEFLNPHASHTFEYYVPLFNKIKQNDLVLNLTPENSL